MHSKFGPEIALKGLQGGGGGGLDGAPFHCPLLGLLPVVNTWKWNLSRLVLVINPRPGHSLSSSHSSPSLSPLRLIFSLSSSLLHSRLHTFPLSLYLHSHNLLRPTHDTGILHTACAPRPRAPPPDFVSPSPILILSPTLTPTPAPSPNSLNYHHVHPRVTLPRRGRVRLVAAQEVQARVPRRAECRQDESHHAFREYLGFSGYRDEEERVVWMRERHE